MDTAEQTFTQTQKIRLPVVFWYSIIMCIVMIGENIYRWDLVDIITPFLQPFLELVIILLYIVGFIWSVIFFFKTQLRDLLRAAIPILINIIALIIIIFVPFTKLTIEQEFRMNLSNREQVVSMVKSGELRPLNRNSDLIKLPAKYSYLSKGGGEIVVESKNGETKILFFTFRGILDNFSGFIYIDSNRALELTDFNGDFKEIKKMGEHWYYGSSS